jgi:putative tryptophan/tyrosine transport system substrate-binding protein
MNRRGFIAGIAGAAVSSAAWPLAARAQQSDQMRRVGVLLAFDETDPVGKARLSIFTQGLAELGWTGGRNLRMDVRWAGASVDRAPMYAKELVELQPDVILANTTLVTGELQLETRSIPIVFAGITDPVGAGLVAGLPRPGGNITGFINLEAAMGGKWLELLTEIAPGVKRVAMMFGPGTAAASYYLPLFEAAARLLKVMPIAAPVQSDAEIESVMTSLGREPGGGLVIPPDGFTNVHRAPIILLAARNKIPAVYQNSFFVRDGGLLSYGADNVDIYRRSASYVDRILWRKAGRSAGSGSCQIRDGCQPQNRQGAWSDGDRMIRLRCKIKWPTTAASGRLCRSDGALPNFARRNHGNPQC